MKSDELMNEFNESFELGKVQCDTDNAHDWHHAMIIAYQS